MASGEPPLVLLTGASGFIGSCLVKQLLEDGHYRVRGTVRDASNEAKTKPLRELVPDAKYPLELVSADLTKDDGWKSAVEGCKYVLHTASPVMKGAQNEATYVDGPVQGVKRLFNALADEGCVKRVILTSTCFASFDRRKEVWTEENWPDDDSYKHIYVRGKALAEKAAWDFVENLPEDKRFELVTLLPGGVFGPNVLRDSFSTNDIIKNLLDGTMGVLPPLYFQVVDMRDLVAIHLMAMTHDKAPGNRYLLSAGTLPVADISTFLNEEFRSQGYQVATRRLPFWLMKVAGWFKADIRMAVDMTSDPSKTAVSRKVKEDFGVDFKPMRQTIIDTAYAMIEIGTCVRKPGYQGRAGVVAGAPADGPA